MGKLVNMTLIENSSQRQKRTIK